MEARTCVYCHTIFTPNKYSPRQKVCSNLACQKRRQLESMKLWREKNPSYFKYDESKGMAWLETQRRRSKIWREKNPDKVQSYRQTHHTEYREYMREYMRQYRQKKKGGTSPPVSENPQTGGS